MANLRLCLQGPRATRQPGPSTGAPATRRPSRSLPGSTSSSLSGRTTGTSPSRWSGPGSASRPSARRTSILFLDLGLICTLLGAQPADARCGCPLDRDACSSRNTFQLGLLICVSSAMLYMLGTHQCMLGTPPCMLWPHSVIRNNYLIWRQRSNPNDAPAGASGTGHVDGFEALTLGSGQLRHRLRPLLPRVHAWFGPMPHLDVLVGVPIVCPMLTGARIVHAIGCGARLPPVTVGCDCDCAVTVPVMCL